ncbi:MAG: amidohydrolase family protein [Rhodococcus sp. (in: high G+C Gram-positive bacteria)]|nr:MAG: amidohydrolase family protein [Rhodococcus sp. (in: high G+C Gram-positive bacteria)]
MADVIFRGVRVFDGRASVLSEPCDVRVTGSLIESIVPVGSAADAPAPGVEVFDGAGRVLMPGLIDAHWHAALAAVPVAVALSADPGYVQLVAAGEAERTLLRGFTTVRDAGGPTFGLKRAIDEGVTRGPRIYPSGAFVSQTAGHGDFRQRYEVPRAPCAHLSHGEVIGAAAIADGVDAVLRAVREQLMLGASQIKVMAGGGVASPYDPIDVTQYTPAEMRAAVEAAENWGTYVLVHAYTPRAIRRAVEAGVRCIEHGHLVDEETVAMMAESGVWWCMQPFLDDEDALVQPGPAGRAKQLAVSAGTDRAYELARKHGVKLAWGTDLLFDAASAAKQGKQLAKMTRWFSPAEVLSMATAANAELVAMSGPRNPYPGRLGVVEEGALADLLLVDGDPLTDLGLLADPDRSLVVVMKDGFVHKDTLDERA